VQAGLATLTLNGSGTTGTASVAVTVTGNQAGLAFLPSTGHYYEYVPDANVTWTATQTAASSLSFDGETGYLASISSGAVNTFIQNHLNGAQNVWAGRTRPVTPATCPRTSP
jgi:hypothetical protein